MFLLVVVVVLVLVEASAPKVYPMVTLASASTLSGSVIRTFRGGEGCPNMFCLVASSLGLLRSQFSIVCGSSMQRGHRGLRRDRGDGYQQWSVAGSQARKEDRVRSVASGHAIFGPGEPAMHLRCPRICRWWTCKRPVVEGSRGGRGDGPWRVAGGKSGCFGCGVCELVAGYSFVSWYPQEARRARSSV